MARRQKASGNLKLVYCYKVHSVKDLKRWVRNKVQQRMSYCSIAEMTFTWFPKWISLVEREYSKAIVTENKVTTVQQPKR